MKRVLVRSLKFLVFAILTIVIGLLLYLSLTEYRPPQIMTFEISTSQRNRLEMEQTYRVLSFNLGYAGLGKEADFFMDGGKGVNPESEDLVRKNMEGIGGILLDIDPDFYLLQELDLNSKRSFYMDQRAYIEDLTGLSSYYAPNFKVEYVPFPLPTIGRVDSGLLSASSYDTRRVDRLSLPVPFKWPIRLANLKRCLLVSYYPIESSDKELVVINLHLEAYDDSGGREEQTRVLAQLMQEEFDKGNYVIAGGDFNQSFFRQEDLDFNLSEDLWKPGFLDDKEFPGGLKILRDEKKLPTCRSLNRPYDKDFGDDSFYVIDGFIVSPNIFIEGLETYDQDFEYSDHNPIVLDFILR